MRALRVLTILLVSQIAWADKVIMKDGKIYEGRIMGETRRSILISNPLETHPRFLALSDVMTVVRESHFDPPSEPRRYVQFMAATGVAGFTSRALGATAAPVLHIESGFRIHPLIEMIADLDWEPTVSGGLGITDGKTLRQYERFSMLNGGFGARVFPWAKTNWRTEPYLMAGYQWGRLDAKGTDDALKGSLWRLGVGVQHPWRENLFVDLRLLYERTRYGRATFLSNDAELVSSIPNDHLLFLLGLSYHWR